jgi:hypothetical protein
MRNPPIDASLEPLPIHKNAPYLRKLRAQYLALLERSSVSEQVVQDFLEKHSELIPVTWMLNHGLHFDVMISKFPLDTSLKCDLAYLTKSTAEWYLTLIELEHPSKPIFTENRRVPTFSAGFNAALGQIASWKAFIEHHGGEVRDRLSPLLGSGRLRRNRVRFKFVLICGRNAELKSNQDRIDRFGQLNGEDFKVLTYDSPVRGLRFRGGVRKNILTVVRKGFKLKHLNCYPGSLFAYLSPHEIEVSNKQLAALKAEGFQMDRWRNGDLLRLNHRYPDVESLMESDAFGEAFFSKPKTPKHRRR